MAAELYADGGETLHAHGYRDSEVQLILHPQLLFPFTGVRLPGLQEQLAARAWSI